MSDAAIVISGAEPQLPQLPQLVRQESRKDEDFWVCGIHLSGLSRQAQLAICTLAVVSVYQLAAMSQEATFKTSNFRYSWFMTFSTFFIGALLASASRLRSGELTTVRAPLYNYFLIGVLILGTHGLANLSLLFINYPVLIVFKSAKLLPVMIGRFLILQKRYSSLDYLSALSFILALTLFTLADVSVEPNFSLVGIVFLGVSLLFDGVIGNLQEKLLTKEHISQAEVVQVTNLVAAVISFVWISLSGELMAAVRACNETPQLWLFITAHGSAAYFGIYVVLILVQHFGSVLATCVTSGRKMLTIFLSFLIFPKPFSVYYVYGSVVLALGMLLSSYVRTKAPAVLSPRVSSAVAAFERSPLLRPLENLYNSLTTPVKSPPTPPPQV